MKSNFKKVKTLADLLVFLHEQETNDKFLNYLKVGDWHQLSNKEFCSRVYNLAHHLKELGLKKGDRFAIFSKSSPHWLIVDFACQLLGIVTVPFFANISEENLEYQIEHSGVKYAFVSGGEQWQVVKPHQQKFKHFVTHDVQLKIANQSNLKKLTTSESCPNKNFVKLARRIFKDDLATIIYTSGSTGVPKGVVLTHYNLISQIAGARESFSLKPQMRVLSFLPLAHIFERMVMCFYLSENLEIYFADEVTNVPNLLQEVKPEVLTTVPRMLEKIYSKIAQNIAELPFVSRIIAGTAYKYASNMPELVTKKSLLKKFFAKTVYHKFLAAFGGEVKLMISGSAALDKQINQFFVNIGLNVLEGYGLTEAAPVISVNTAKARRLGSVGKAYPGVKIKIAKNNEILAAGPNIMQGYYKAKAKTTETMSGNYLKTGDLGYLDKDGFLYITGRLKELQKTSYGKYVPVQKLEGELKKLCHVEQAIIVADGKKFVSAIIFPDLALQKKQKLSKRNLQKTLAAEIAKLNKKLNKWEQIQKFIIASQEPTVVNGQLTPSFKLRREPILEAYAQQIDNLYS